MKAVILAAGKGSRMGDLTRHLPKCLLQIGDQPVLSYQLNALAQNGINTVFIVTGYRHNQVRAFVGDAHTLIYNERYETTNSMASLFLARLHLSGAEFILINGDILFHPKTLAPLLRAGDCATLVDTTGPFTDGEMHVVIQNNQVKGFSKEIPAAKAQGLSAQITKFGRKESSLLFDRIETFLKEGQQSLFPASAFDIIMEQSIMYPVPVQPLDWNEMDVPEDIKKCELKAQAWLLNTNETRH